MNIKSDFPFFKNNPETVYLDNAASIQKPQYVIDQTQHYITHDYSNIHRWSYDSAQRSEEIYQWSKKIVAEHLNVNRKEIIYTYNATYAFNIIVQTLCENNFLTANDNIILSISEHHANIVPRLHYQKKYWYEIRFVSIDKNFDIDTDHFQQLYDDKTKIVSLQMISNVSWSVYNLEKIKNLTTSRSLFIIDASQWLAHFDIDNKQYNADIIVATWHKLMAYTGIGIMMIKQELQQQLQPSISWGWAIDQVKQNNYTTKKNREKFEPWTPDIIGAVSLKAAFEYRKNIWWATKCHNYDQELCHIICEEFKKIPQVKIIGKQTPEKRVSIFSFHIPWIHHQDIGDFFAQHNVAIRCWWHCTHPFFSALEIQWSCRMSCYRYTTPQDIQTFFAVLKKCIHHFWLSS